MGDKERHSPGDPPQGPTVTFVFDGEHWTIEFQNRLIRLRDSPGLQYLSRLLRQPGTPISAADLLVAPGPTAQPVPAHARVSVTKHFRSAIRRIGKYFPELGVYLSRTVTTGRRCCYTPDPQQPVTWKL